MSVYEEVWQSFGGIPIEIEWNREEKEKLESMIVELIEEKNLYEKNYNDQTV